MRSAVAIRSAQPQPESSMARMTARRAQSIARGATNRSDLAAEPRRRYDEIRAAAISDGNLRQDSILLGEGRQFFEGIAKQLLGGDVTVGRIAIGLAGDPLKQHIGEGAMAKRRQFDRKLIAARCGEDRDAGVARDFAQNLAVERARQRLNAAA